MSNQEQKEEKQYQEMNFDNENEQKTDITHPSQAVSEPKLKEQTPINHLTIGQYANSTLEQQSQTGNGIKIGIIGTETKGSMLSKYTVYLIKGSDKNGQIQVFRRFNQFHQMRLAMSKRWPGCFIPSIPDKSINKTDNELVRKRARYLNDFLRKISKLPHLYNSEQFQTLLRSKQKDISDTFQQWPFPSTENIIDKYKGCFSHLAGKQVSNQTRAEITQFVNMLQRNQPKLEAYRKDVKRLAMERDKLDAAYPHLISEFLPSYERTCLSECVGGQESLMVCLNPDEAKFAEHQSIVAASMQKNPYWLLYDLLKHESRDGLAFLQIVQAMKLYEQKKGALDIKISQNSKSAAQLSLGMSSMKTMTSKGTSDELRYKLQIQIEALKKERELVLTLADIISALIAYVQIKNYKDDKKHFYQTTLKKIGGFQINFVQNVGEVWNDWRRAITRAMKKCN